MAYPQDSKAFLGDQAPPYSEEFGGVSNPYKGPIRWGPLRRRAMLGWSCAILGCITLELTGALGYYQRGLGFAAACQCIVLLFILTMTNLFFSWRPRDQYNQNWLLNIVITLGLMFGMLGGQLGGYYFARWGELSARVDHTNVSPDSSPLALINPGKISFQKASTLRGLQMGGAQYTSSNRLENRFRWYSCATPIVSSKTTDIISYWAITEGISPCSAPQNICGEDQPCFGYTLAGNNGRAAAAVDAATKEHGLKILPGSVYLSMNTMPHEYTQASLNKALCCSFVTVLLIPIFTWIIYYILCLYQGIYFYPVYGAHFPKSRQE